MPNLLDFQCTKWNFGIAFLKKQDFLWDLRFLDINSYLIIHPVISFYSFIHNSDKCTSPVMIQQGSIFLFHHKYILVYHFQHPDIAGQSNRKHDFIKHRLLLQSMIQSFQN